MIGARSTLVFSFDGHAKEKESITAIDPYRLLFFFFILNCYKRKRMTEHTIQTTNIDIHNAHSYIYRVSHLHTLTDKTMTLMYIYILTYTPIP